MGKISPVSSKYIIHANIETDGVVEKPDVIGAIFGQTEGLLGAELELRELQRSGRIGRIEVTIDIRGGKAQGTIIIPSSLDKAETAIVGAALEIIQRIGPCNSRIKVKNIEDVRISKRNLVVGRAKELLKDMTENTLPDSQELADEVMYSVRVMEIQEYGKDRLPSGPMVEQSDEVLVVEGRADVLNLLKHGFKNAIAMNGTSVPQTIIDLSKQKTIIAFVDGDRGGDLNIRELLSVAEIDFVTKAPDGKEVEEITKKEIHKALRAKISAEQAKMETGGNSNSSSRSSSTTSNQYKRQSTNNSQNKRNSSYNNKSPSKPSYQQKGSYQKRQSPPSLSSGSKVNLSQEEKTKFKSMLEDLIGTRGAYVLDEKMNILGKVPISELGSTVKSLSSGIHAIVFDGAIEKDLVEIAEKAKVNYLVGMDTKVNKESTSITILTATDL